MPNQQYSISNTDRGNNNAFTVPGDEDGGVGDDSFALEANANPKQNSIDSYVHVENGWDVDVDVTLQGSHFLDETMGSAAQDGSAITITKNDGTDFFDITSSHSFVEVDVDPAGTPTSGELTITFQSRET